MDSKEVFMPLSRLSRELEKHGYERSYASLRRYSRYGVSIGDRNIRLHTVKLNGAQSARVADYEQFLDSQIAAQQSADE
jgi:hypothetical protein